MAGHYLETLSRFKPGDVVAGFELVRAEHLPEMRLAALEFRHLKSGARMLHLAADDPENLFSVAFRTPPPDDTGLPHILEHTVLCGSKRYPVKDPFVELLKTSLATFLNASTYPDRTLYPCASMNHKDFHNLMRVYADAAFFPVLSEDHFRQEGHHFVFGADGKAGIKGVVYNEMRGVYSDPEGILFHHIQAILFAANAYGRDYGGDPKHIPDLTYKQFVDFHRTYYHPANAWIFTYGDADPAAAMDILDKDYLSAFDAIQLDTAIKPMQPWTEPKQAVFPYPIDAADTPDRKTDISVSFATNDRRDPLQTLAMQVIDIYLLDNAASPLRKALIDSKLGEELGGSDYADHQRDTYFTVVLKGSEPDRADAVEKLILDAIRRECDAGFNPEMLESALHSLELASREIRPHYPLHLMDRAFASWLYDSDPMKQIQLSRRLDDLRAALKADSRFLEKLARAMLVDNPCRLRIVLTPDKEYLEKLDAETNADIERRLSKLSGRERASAASAAARLEEEQSKGNSPEALATLPKLAIGDVSRDPIPLESSAETFGKTTFITVPIYTGGIGYLNLNLLLSDLDDEEVNLLPLMCEALQKGGAAGMDYAEMAVREAAVTGALDVSAGIAQHVDGPGLARLKLQVWLKALDSDWEKALRLLSDRLFQADFSDTDRLRDIVLQSRMAWRNQIVPAGNAYAALYAARNLTPTLAVAERLGGCTQARYVDAVAAGVETHLSALPGRLARLRDKVLAVAVPAAAQAGADGSVRLSRDWLQANGGRFGGSAVKAIAGGVSHNIERIGLAAPSDVAYAAAAMPAPIPADPAAPALMLLGTQLSYGMLWNEVRVKGGAYGVRGAFDGGRGAFTFSSYRDPNVCRTLKTFTNAKDYVLNEMDLSPNGVEQAIIGTLKSLDQPVRPSYAVTTALARHLGGEDEAFRRRFRERLLSLTADDIRNAASLVFKPAGGASVCAVAGREKLQEENAAAAENERLDIKPLWETGD